MGQARHLKSQGATQLPSSTAASLPSCMTHRVQGYVALWPFPGQYYTPCTAVCTACRLPAKACEQAKYKTSHKTRKAGTCKSQPHARKKERQDQLLSCKPAAYGVTSACSITSSHLPFSCKGTAQGKRVETRGETSTLHTAQQRHGVRGTKHPQYTHTHIVPPTHSWGAAQLAPQHQ